MYIGVLCYIQSRLCLDFVAVKLILCILIFACTLKIMMLQGSLLMGGQLNSHDHFRDWRLDVDNMSYEVIFFFPQVKLSIFLYHNYIPMLFMYCPCTLFYVCQNFWFVFDSNC